jgi:hypothetical protein
MKSEVYKRNVDTRDELLSRILVDASCIKSSGSTDVKITRSSCVSFNEVEGRIFEYLFKM